MVRFDPYATVALTILAGTLFYLRNKERIDNKVSGFVELCKKYLIPERLSHKDSSITNLYRI